MCQEVEKEAVRFAQHLHSDGARVLRVPASISVLEALLGAHALADHEVRTHDRTFETGRPVAKTGSGRTNNITEVRGGICLPQERGENAALRPAAHV